jgi:uncharacterized protein YcaQ
MICFLYTHIPKQMPEQPNVRHIYDIPPNVMINLAIMIAEYPHMSHAEMANAYYENLRDRIGIIGYSEIPTNSDLNRNAYVARLNRFTPNRPVITLRMVTFQAFRLWSSIDRFRNISIDDLLDEMEILARHRSISGMNIINGYDSHDSGSDMEEEPLENHSENHVGNPPLIINESDEIVNIADIE